MLWGNPPTSVALPFQNNPLGVRVFSKQTQRCAALQIEGRKLHKHHMEMSQLKVQSCAKRDTVSLGAKMMGYNFIFSKQIRMSFALAAIFGLVACDETGKFALPSLAPGAITSGDAATPANQNSTQLVDRDVEAPDVFQLTDQGLWDGRPSLGGVWVAHPDATDPERVIIRNSSNGKFVIGALFRRERENPGPSLQVSSDAAEALGLLAGAPASLNVTALRREEAAVEPVIAATTDFDAPTNIAGTQLDPIAGAAAAIDAAELVASAPIPAPTTTPTASSSLTKPFIQIGIFSIEANARRTAERLRGDGISSRVLAQESQGRKFWRVIVGPTPTQADRATILGKVKALGFTDAYFVTN
jgi:cell division septation protein DedD